MGYLFIGCALACGLIKGYCGKRSSSTAVHTSDAMLINTLRMGLCILIGAVMALYRGELGALFSEPRMIPIALLGGAGTACFVVSWLLSVRRSAYMMVEVFIMASVLVPTVLCAVIYGEDFGWLQGCGIALLLVAVWCICTYNKEGGRVRLTWKDLILLLVCCLSNGFTDFSQKLFTHEISGGSASLFQLWTYLFSGLFLVVTYFIFRRRESRTEKSPTPPAAVLRPILHYVAIMATCLFLNSYFKTLAANLLDAVLLYPLMQGCSVVLSLLMSVFIFREKINFKGIVGIALALLSLLVINLLPTLIA